MDQALSSMAEALGREFGELRSGDVVDVLNDCVDEHPFDGSLFIEQAARARLALLRATGPAGGQMSTGDSLEVSLHDNELAEEVELTVRLMVAANDVDRPLRPDEVDALLEVRRQNCWTVPRQATHRS